MSNLKLRLSSAACVAAVVGISIAGGSTASAREPDESRAAAAVPANSVNSTSVVNESLTGTDVKNGSLYQSDLNPAVADLLRTPKANSVWTSTLNNDVVTEPKLAPAVRNKLVATGTALSTMPIPIQHMAGTNWLTTPLGEFTLPAGVWMISTNAYFYRSLNGVEGTRPAVSLRYNRTPTNTYGQNAGTLQGVEISERANGDLYSSTTKRVVFTQPTKIDLVGFGHNDNESDAGAGQITVQVEVTWARG